MKACFVLLAMLFARNNYFARTHTRVVSRTMDAATRRWFFITGARDVGVCAGGRRVGRSADSSPFGNWPKKTRLIFGPATEVRSFRITCARGPERILSSLLSDSSVYR